jgi:uncharacterized protein
MKKGTLRERVMRRLFSGVGRPSHTEKKTCEDQPMEEEIISQSIAPDPQDENLLHLLESNLIDEGLFSLLESDLIDETEIHPVKADLENEIGSHPEPHSEDEIKFHPVEPNLNIRRSTMSNLSALQGILQTYVVSSADIQGAVVVTPDGLALASVLPNAMDEEKTAAMSAAMLSLGERIGKELARGNIDRIFVQGDTGYGVLTSCGNDAMLLTLASKDAKQGMLFLEIKQMSDKVSAAMGATLSFS